MPNEKLIAQLEAKKAELKGWREKRLKLASMSANDVSISTDPSVKPEAENRDSNKILEEVDVVIKQLNILPDTSEEKYQPPINTLLQICQQPSATIDIEPKELITYSKEVQTTKSNENDLVTSQTQYDHLEPSDNESEKSFINMLLTSASEFNFKHSSKQQNETSLMKHELNNDQCEEIMKNEQFQDFFARTSRLIERSLWESPYTSDLSKDFSEKNFNKTINNKDIIKFDREFFDEFWSRERIVTSIDVSTYHPELILASYSENDTLTQQSDGVVLIWNIKFKTKPTPEYIFNCQSWVTSCVFSKFHPNIIIGGTHSGQIVVWDTRENKRTPVQCTPLSATSHTHPIYCLQVIGTQNANNLISVSNEGKMCSWNIEMMKEPQETMDLTYRTRSIATTRMVFPGVEANHFIVGSEEGQVYFGSRHGNQVGIQESYEGHSGPITGLSCHNGNSSIDSSSLFLTSSFDWSVKLWSLKESKPLHSFEVNNDYLTDVCWSPVHPSVFLTCDINGRFDIWNINNDLEIPLLSTTLNENVALNKCLWSHNGEQIILGDDQGKLHLYNVNEFLTHPKQDEFDKLINTLQEYKQNIFDTFDQPTDGTTISTYLNSSLNI